MLDRDLKVIAMQMAAHLPDDETTSRRVYALLGELIDQWLYNQPSNPFMAGDCSASNVTKFIGKADISPR